MSDSEQQTLQYYITKKTVLELKNARSGYDLVIVTENDHKKRKRSYFHLRKIGARSSDWASLRGNLDVWVVIMLPFWLKGLFPISTNPSSPLLIWERK